LFTDVLSVLHSWIRRSLGIANVCCFSPALLYGLLYKEVESSEIGAGVVFGSVHQNRQVSRQGEHGIWRKTFLNGWCIAPDPPLGSAKGEEASYQSRELALCIPGYGWISE